MTTDSDIAVLIISQWQKSLKVYNQSKVNLHDFLGKNQGFENYHTLRSSVIYY